MGKAANAVLLALTLTACDRAASPIIEPVQEVTLAFTDQPQCALIQLAIAKDYFREEGLRVKPQMHTYGKAALAAVLEQRADIATVAETPIMFSVLKGEDIVVIANMAASNTSNAVIARRDAGIAGTEDLRGKKIGYTPGTTSDFFLDSLLTASGLERQDIRPVALRPEEMQAALLQHQVDAVSTWSYPLAKMAAALAADGLVIYDRNIYTETFNLVAPRTFVAQHPATVQRVLRAMIRAEEFARAHPDEAQTIVATANGVDKRLVQAVWDRFKFRIRLDQSLLISLEDETRWAIDNMQADAKRMPDYLAHIYFAGLEAVRPASVRILR